MGEYKDMFVYAIILGLGFGMAIEVVGYAAELWKLKKERDARADSR